MSDPLLPIIARTLGLPESAIHDDLSRDSEPAWDSFNHLMLITELEKAFSLRFGVDEPAQLKTVADLRRAVARPR